MDRSWDHSCMRWALGTDDTAGWRVSYVNIRPWLSSAVNRQNTGITKVLLWTCLEALWARRTAVMVLQLEGQSRSEKRGTTCRLPSTHKSKRIQFSWLLGVFPPQIPQPGNTRWGGFYLHCSFSTIRVKGKEEGDSEYFQHNLTYVLQG
jgi:hypothetical protein